MLFKNLSKDEGLMYHVVARCRNRKTNQFYHQIDKLAEYAGLNHYSGVYAIKGLIDKKIISRESRPGHSSIYTFLQELNLFEPASDKEKATTRSVAQGYHQPVAQGYHITTTPNNNNLTTTWLTEKLSNSLIAKYGQKPVSDRVVVISKMNGQIKNKAGLLVASLKGNYIPASKELREKEESQRIALAIEAKSEKDRLEREEIVKAHEESKLTSKQIKKMFDQIEKGN
jgi:hypothetical protein